MGVSELLAEGHYCPGRSGYITRFRGIRSCPGPGRYHGCPSIFAISNLSAYSSGWGNVIK